MKNKVKQNVSVIEIIREAMEQREWKPIDLARESKVSTGVLSRFFHDDGISAANLFKIMQSLDLIKNMKDEHDQACVCYNWTEKEKQACQKTKRILNSKDPIIVAALETNLAAFSDSISKNERITKIEKDIHHLKKIHTLGTNSGAGEAVPGTGQKKRAM